MAQLKSQYDEVRVPLTKMSFTPDVPSAALGPNEYDDGFNIETDVRGIRSVAGDTLMPQLGGSSPQILFVTSGFISNGIYVYILAVNYTSGLVTTTKWMFTTDFVSYNEITPQVNYAGTFSTYSLNTNITCVWNGTVPIFNDTINPPFFWLNSANNDPSFPSSYSVMSIYSNTPPISIQSVTVVSSTVIHVQFQSGGYNYNYGSGHPYLPSTSVTITGTGTFDGTFVVASTNNTQYGIDLITSVSYVGVTSVSTGTISPLYLWNYFPTYLSTSANFLRMYSTPNVGSILIVGGLTFVPLNSPSTTQVFPVTVQWSQNFGLNEVPLTWQPTITDVANQLEVPLRGPCQDAFGSNGQFFICSYWDTVVFSPLNYTTTSAPILGVRLYTQGRGMLSSNCWAALDNFVYGIDARDVWVFDGQNFTGIGNQRVKNWLFDQIDPKYYNMVYMIANTEKSQIEIYYPTSTATNGIPNVMISYRYDLDCWNAPRQVTNAISACESPIVVNNGSSYVPQFSSRCIIYADAINHRLVQKDQGYTINGYAISSNFVRTNLKLLPNYSGKLMVHRMLPEAVNLGAIPFSGTYNIQLADGSTGNLSVQLFGSNSAGQLSNEEASGTIALDTDNPWIQSNQNTSRLNDIYIYNNSSNSVWMCTAMTFQYTQVEDDR